MTGPPDDDLSGDDAEAPIESDGRLPRQRSGAAFFVAAFLVLLFAGVVSHSLTTLDRSFEVFVVVHLVNGSAAAGLIAAVAVRACRVPGRRPWVAAGALLASLAAYAILYGLMLVGFFVFWPLGERLGILIDRLLRSRSF